MERISVLVVGAGPTGLTLACGLRQHGIDIRIVEQAAGAASTSRALGLQLRGAEALDRVGALADIPDRAVKALNAHIDADWAFGGAHAELDGEAGLDLFRQRVIRKELLGEFLDPGVLGRRLGDLRPAGPEHQQLRSGDHART